MDNVTARVTKRVFSPVGFIENARAFGSKINAKCLVPHGNDSVIFHIEDFYGFSPDEVQIFINGWYDWTGSFKDSEYTLQDEEPVTIYVKIAIEIEKASIAQAYVDSLPNYADAALLGDEYRRIHKKRLRRLLGDQRHRDNMIAVLETLAAITVVKTASNDNRSGYIEY